jgi:predicted lipid-binding transport protein (Tim44 family)
MNIPESVTIVDFIILIACIFLGIQIYRVLGTRTGTEKKRSTPQFNEAIDEQSDKPVPNPKYSKALKNIKDPKVIDGLDAIHTQDAGFNLDTFLQGAEKAFDMILQAFLKGDKTKLKPLLSTALYNEFSALIDARVKKKQTAELVFFRFIRADVLEASVERKIARIKLALKTEQTLVVKKGNEVVEGDPDHIDDVVDVWTFERKLNSSSPIWVLSHIDETNEENQEN